MRTVRKFTVNLTYFFKCKFKRRKVFVTRAVMVGLNVDSGCLIISGKREITWTGQYGMLQHGLPSATPMAVAPGCP